MEAKHWTILIAGGHAAGKKLVCKDLEKSLNNLASDDMPINVETLHMADYQSGDGPKNVDFNKIKSGLKNKKTTSGEQCVTIIEGYYALYDEEIRDNSVMKVFVDSDADTRLSRWILRDIGPDQTKLGEILDRYLTLSRPEFNQYIAPTKQFADVILPRGSEQSGVELLSNGIYDRIREELPLDGGSSAPSGISTPILGQKAVNLRKESFLEQSQRFYDLS